jgi:hypothetical protein
MKKEEFPTFLNQQPKVVFGRTGRELLIIVCGIVSSYTLWGAIHTLLLIPWWSIVSVLLSILPLFVALIVALIPVAERPLEEWAMCWLLYAWMPRLFLYESQEEDLEQAEEQNGQAGMAHKKDILHDDFDED